MYTKILTTNNNDFLQQQFDNLPAGSVSLDLSHHEITNLNAEVYIRFFNNLEGSLKIVAVNLTGIQIKIIGDDQDCFDKYSDESFIINDLIHALGANPFLESLELSNIFPTSIHNTGELLQTLFKESDPTENGFKNLREFKFRRNQLMERSDFLDEQYHYKGDREAAAEQLYNILQINEPLEIKSAFLQFSPEIIKVLLLIFLQLPNIRYVELDLQQAPQFIPLLYLCIYAQSVIDNDGYRRLLNSLSFSLKKHIIYYPGKKEVQANGCESYASYHINFFNALRQQPLLETLCICNIIIDENVLIHILLLLNAINFKRVKFIKCDFFVDVCDLTMMIFNKPITVFHFYFCQFHRKTFDLHYWREAKNIHQKYNYVF